MEEARQYDWRSKLMLMNNVIDHHSSSWEEKAFAEDHYGGIGGCIWPPRSYSCSFCKREFRSAQALGGHMNVHRKDRARLKQSSSSSSSPPDHHQHPYQTNHHNSSSTTVLASTSRVSVLSTKQHKDSNVSKPEVVKNLRQEASSMNLSDKNDGKSVCNNNLFSYKKAKTETSAHSLIKPCSNDRCGIQSEVPGLISSSFEDIDLELRLGQPPKVN